MTDAKDTNDVLNDPEFVAWCGKRHLVAGGWAWEAWVEARSRLKEELKRAIEHDRQPYPTADAYEKVCAALAEMKAEREKDAKILGDRMLEQSQELLSLRLKWESDVREAFDYGRRNYHTPPELLERTLTAFLSALASRKEK